MGNKTPAMTLQDIPASEFDAALGRKCEWVSGWRAGFGFRHQCLRNEHPVGTYHSYRQCKGDHCDRGLMTKEQRVMARGIYD